MATASLLSIDEARQTVLGSCTPLPAEQVPLTGDLLGRVLAGDIAAAEAVPAFASSAMDGFAVRAGDTAQATPERPATLAVVGESRAGAPAGLALGAGEAIAISTGAVMPDGADAIVRVEDTDRVDGRVRVHARVDPGQEVRGAGEDLQAGRTVLSSGTVLGPAELGVLASIGCLEAPCARRPRVAVIASGDELLAPGEPMRPGAIRDSSSMTIPALALCAGADVTSCERVPDDPVLVRAAIARGLEADVLVVCGGVSVGAHDHVRPALAELGVEQRFWGLALRPGKPAWFGTRTGTLAFGLPGNPVSSMVTFVLLVGPALRALAGASPARDEASAVLACDYEKPAGRAHALRVRLCACADGWRAEPMPAQGSHVLSSMVGADALAVIPAERERVACGERVQVRLLAGWSTLRG